MVSCYDISLYRCAMFPFVEFCLVHLGMMGGPLISDHGLCYFWFFPHQYIVFIGLHFLLVFNAIFVFGWMRYPSLIRLCVGFGHLSF